MMWKLDPGPFIAHLFCKDLISTYWALPTLFKEIPLSHAPEKKKKKLGWFLAVLQGPE